MSVRTSARRQATRRARRPRWTPPTIDDRYVRSSDQAVHTVGQVYRANQQVQLKPVDGGKPIYVWAYELDSDWERLTV